MKLTYQRLNQNKEVETVHIDTELKVLKPFSDESFEIGDVISPPRVKQLIQRKKAQRYTEEAIEETPSQELSEEEADTENSLEEEKQPTLWDKVKDFLSRFNWLVFLGCLTVFFGMLVLCFSTLFLKICFVISGFFCSIYLLYITFYTEDSEEEEEEDSDIQTFSFNKLEDGFEVIPYEENGVKLSDLIMQDPVEEIQDLVDYLKAPEDFEKFGYQPETRILLVGETGLGKSTFVKAFANETKQHIVRVHAGRLTDDEKIIPKLFQMANFLEHYILQIDSFESLVDSSLLGNNDSSRDVLKKYLEVYTNVTLMALCEDSTSLSVNESTYDIFFKKVISFEAPEQEERIAFLKKFSAHLNLDEKVDFNLIAKNCMGFTISELKYLVATTISMAKKHNRTNIIQDDFFEAFDSLEFGKTSDKYNQKSREIAAYHEAGHAIARHLLFGTKSILRVISISHGDSGGMTIPDSNDENIVTTEEELKNSVCSILAGRCAERIQFNQLSTGASSDIILATSIIKNMVTSYGMSDKIGPLNVAPKLALNAVITESEEMKNLISQECVRIAKECDERTMSLLKDNRKSLDKLAHYLIEHESITGDEMEQLLSE